MPVWPLVDEQSLGEALEPLGDRGLQVLDELRVRAVWVLGHESLGLATFAGGAIIEAVGYQVAFLTAGPLTVVGVLLALRAPEPARAT